jgi:hypothetical protein
MGLLYVMQVMLTIPSLVSVACVWFYAFLSDYFQTRWLIVMVQAVGLSFALLYGSQNLGLIVVFP